MNHQEIQETLWFFRDPELPAEKRREIAEHAESCEECRSALNRLERLNADFAKVQMPPTSERFVSGVMDELRRLEEPEPAPAPRPHFFPRWLFPALGYGVAVLLMFVAILHREPVVSTETVLLAGVPQGTHWVFSHEQPSVGQLLSVREGT